MLLIDSLHVFLVFVLGTDHTLLVTFPSRSALGSFVFVIKIIYHEMYLPVCHIGRRMFQARLHFHRIADADAIQNCYL